MKTNSYQTMTYGSWETTEAAKALRLAESATNVAHAIPIVATVYPTVKATAWLESSTTMIAMSLFADGSVFAAAVSVSKLNLTMLQAILGEKGDASGIMPDAVIVAESYVTLREGIPSLPDLGDNAWEPMNASFRDSVMEGPVVKTLGIDWATLAPEDPADKNPDGFVPTAKELEKLLKLS